MLPYTITEHHPSNSTQGDPSVAKGAMKYVETINKGRLFKNQKATLSTFESKIFNFETKTDELPVVFASALESALETAVGTASKATLVATAK